MQTIERHGDGSYTYRYNLHPVIRDSEMGPEEYWEYDPVLLYGYPNVKDCIKAVIRLYVTVDQEFDLINSYNNPNKTLEDTDKYMNYLNLLSEIKENVKKDFNETGIY